MSERNTKMHVCTTCDQDIPECKAGPDDVEYGDGVGNDNITYCKYFTRDGLHWSDSKAWVNGILGDGR